MLRRASALANMRSSCSKLSSLLSKVFAVTVVDGQLCFVEHRLDLFSSALIAGHPATAEFLQVVELLYRSVI